MIYHSISQYLEAKNDYLNTSGKIICGEGFYYVDGKLIPDKEYLKYNSLPTFEPIPRENIDKQNITPSIKIKKRY